MDQEGAVGRGVLKSRAKDGVGIPIGIIPLSCWPILACSRENPMPPHISISVDL